MNGGSQNSFSQQWSLTPGRVIRKIKRHIMPSGKIVELQWISTTIRDNQGVWHTEEVIEMVPPPEDGSVVTESNYENLKECTRCLAATIEPYQCPKCCRWVCMVCTEDDVPVQGQLIRACKDCAWKIKHPYLSSLNRLIWEG